MKCLNMLHVHSHFKHCPWYTCALYISCKVKFSSVLRYSPFMFVLSKKKKPYYYDTPNLFVKCTVLNTFIHKKHFIGKHVVIHIDCLCNKDVHNEYYKVSICLFNF